MSYVHQWESTTDGGVRGTHSTHPAQLLCYMAGLERMLSRNTMSTTTNNTLGWYKPTNGNHHVTSRTSLLKFIKSKMLWIIWHAVLKDTTKNSIYNIIRYRKRPSAVKHMVISRRLKCGGKCSSSSQIICQMPLARALKIHTTSPHTSSMSLVWLHTQAEKW